VLVVPLIGEGEVMEKRIGYIDVWFEHRNFGFVHETLTGGRIYKLFLHSSNVLTGTPRSGLTVKFNEGRNFKGALAIDVEVFEPVVGLEVLASATKTVRS
jgi:hypothetical protein